MSDQKQAKHFPPSDKMTLPATMSTKVVGLSFLPNGTYPGILHTLAAVVESGQRPLLKLVRDPENQFDANAVAVRSAKKLLVTCDRSRQPSWLRLRLTPVPKGVGKPSYIVSTSTVPIYRGEDRPRGVQVAVCGEPASLTPENSLTQPQAFLGSRTASGAGHRRVCGRNQHHLSARPAATLDQFSLRLPDSRIRSLPSHGRLGKELRLEVLKRDQSVVVDHPFRPHAGRVLRLSLALLRHLRCCKLGPLVTFARRLPLRSTTPSHPPLPLRQLVGTGLAMPTERKVVFGIRRGGSDLHAPVDPDGTTSNGERLPLSPHNKRGVPVSKTIPMHHNSLWVGRQLPRPDDRNADRQLGEPQPSVDYAEALLVADRRERCLTVLSLRSATALNRERLPESLAVASNHLMLCGGGSIAQPRHFCSGCRQELPEFTERRLPSSSLLVHRFIPDPPAPAPLSQKRQLGLLARPKPIAVPSDLLHEPHFTSPLRHSGAKKGTHLGHLPAALAARIAPEMDDGVFWLIESYDVLVMPGHEDNPGLSLNLRRISERSRSLSHPPFTVKSST